MLVLLLFAFISGVITILSPCILPVLPIVLSGGISGGKSRPLGVLVGFIVSFAIFTLTLSAIVQAIGIPVDTLRYMAVVLIILFGLVMIIPWFRDRFELLTSCIASRGSNLGSMQKSGFWSGIIVGLSLGLIWTPCVGPIMASVISLALTQHVTIDSVFITLAYTLGTSIPMFGVMLGGRALLTKVPALTRNMANIQKVFGVVMILVGVAIGFGWDRQFQAAILRAFPNYGSGLTVIEKTKPVETALKTIEPTHTVEIGDALKIDKLFQPQQNTPEHGVLSDYGKAPDFLTKGNWFNTEGISPIMGQGPQGVSMPLMMENLRGKVVLVDFWTYSCVNCVRTLPYLKDWYQKYKDRGLVIVGVHTPEFEFEKSTANVARAIKELGVTWPVVQDNNYKEWTAYGNQYWPAHYFIDANGHVRYFHFGEGEYDVSEKVIQELLKEAGYSVNSTVSNPVTTIETQTPETYLGYDREKGLLTNEKLVKNKPTEYTPPKAPGNGEWTLNGTWIITPQYLSPSPMGILELGFNAKNVFLVIEPEDQNASINLFVDGKIPTNTSDVKSGYLLPTESRMYQLVGESKAAPHLLRLQISGKLRLFAFTFG
jgi:cytochrome c biogenesis protein CcdA/thiol-disulfide isomerase/thioredoxin